MVPFKRQGHHAAEVDSAEFFVVEKMSLGSGHMNLVVNEDVDDGAI